MMMMVVVNQFEASGTTWGQYQAVPAFTENERRQESVRDFYRPGWPVYRLGMETH